ncbi:uncharacterized protein M6B38_371420 [Iris pallida]|uniref:Uncharacterized protein n=1 Tax=Iris pallida TaxID=29817 RepID=A0AAX6GD22_IRIPA|nr:uncharacterized protein M6B38_371420 [Iris pallida]
MANFLWNSMDSHRRCWIAWSRVCRPMTEGGLDIRSLDQVMFSLYAKRCWSFVKKESLWAQYMIHKYGNPSTPDYSIRYKPLPLWRSMTAIFHRVFLHYRWVIGRGNTPNRAPNWYGIPLPKPIAFRLNPNICQIVVDPYCRDIVENNVDVRTLLSNVALTILRNLELTNEKDCIYWILTQQGEFTTQSYWNHYRNRNDTNN